MGTTTESPRGTLARNLAAIRQRRRLTVRALSDRLAGLGVRLLPSGITKTEQGARGVDVNELVALAIALNVSPVRLLLPDTYDDQPVWLTPAKQAPTWLAWSWAEGVGPLSELESDEEREAYDRERPTQLRQLVHDPARRAAEQIRFGVMRLLSHARASNTAGSRESVNRYLQYARREMQVLSTELDRIEEEVDDRG